MKPKIFATPKLFRFRKVKTVFEYKELHNCEIFMSPLNKLNDPIEGKIHIVWEGDNVAWEGLIKNYGLCLFIALSSQQMGIDNEFVTKINPGNYHDEKSPYVKFVIKAYDDFFDTTEGKSLITILSNAKITEEYIELLFHTLIHKISLEIIIDVFNKQRLIDEDNYLAQNKFTVSSGDKQKIIQNFDKLIKTGNSAIVKDSLLETYKLMTETLTLINFEDENKNNMKFILLEFPVQYVRKLKDSIHHYYGVACFSETYENPVMWGVYANNHEGIVLIYDINVSEGIPKDFFIDTKEINSNTAIGYGEFHFNKVKYLNQKNEVNFFEHLSTFSNGSVKQMLTDSNKGHSKLYSTYYKDSREWFQNNRNIYIERMITKTSHWSHEKEWRLSLGGLHDRFGKEGISIKYNPKYLVGIVFGINTPIQDKRTIMEIIRLENNHERKNFGFFQARYNFELNNIEAVPIIDVIG